MSRQHVIMKKACKDEASMTNHLFFKNAVIAKPTVSEINHKTTNSIECGTGFSGAFKAVCLSVLDSILSNPMPMHDFMQYLMNFSTTLPTPYNFIQTFKENSQKQIDLTQTLLQAMVFMTDKLWQDDSSSEALWLLTKPLDNHADYAVIYTLANVIGIEILLSQTKRLQEIPHMINCLTVSKQWTQQIGKLVISEYQGAYSIIVRNELTKKLSSSLVTNLLSETFRASFFDEPQQRIRLTALENYEQLRYMQEKNLLNKAGALQLITEQLSKDVFHGSELNVPKKNELPIIGSFMNALAWMMSCGEQEPTSNNVPGL